MANNSKQKLLVVENQRLEELKNKGETIGLTPGTPIQCCLSY